MHHAKYNASVKDVFVERVGSHNFYVGHFRFCQECGVEMLCCENEVFYGECVIDALSSAAWFIR
jgi:hypothetical protein